MMFNFRRRKGGFSLIELLIAVTIMLLIVGIAAFFLEDYLYKSKAAKALQDLDIFASALQLRNSVEPAVFSAYNYNSQVQGQTVFFSWYPIAIAGWGAGWAASGGATSVWSDYSANSLNALIGSYLASVPKDPWGMPYVLNTSAGYIASMGSDLNTCIGGNSNGITESGREKDLVRYYLGDKLVMTSIAVTDVDNSNTVSGGDYMDITFNKDVQWTGAAINLTPATGLATSDFQIADYETGPWPGTFPLAVDFGATVNGGNMIRLKDNGRVLRLIFPNTVVNTRVLGKWMRFNCSNYFNGTITCNSRIVDMDQYSKGTLSGSLFSFGRPLLSTNNFARQIAFKTF